MPNINTGDVSHILQPGLNNLFMKNYLDYDSKLNYKDISTLVNSNAQSEDYAWLVDTPQMREWIDERQINAIGEESYVIKNKTWEATLGIERTVIEDDQYGQIKIRIENLAKGVATHKNKLVFETLIGGASNKCFDGQYFFATNHKYTGKGSYSTTQSNKGSLTLTADNLKTSITNMGKLKGSNGEFLNIIPDTIVVPPDLEWTARELTISPQLGTSNSYNPLQGSLKVVVSPYITDVDSWYLLDCSNVMKPIILQERTPVELISMKEDSNEGFMRDLFMFGVRSRYNTGYSYWQLAYANIP